MRIEIVRALFSSSLLSFRGKSTNEEREKKLFPFIHHFFLLFSLPFRCIIISLFSLFLFLSLSLLIEVRRKREREREREGRRRNFPFCRFSNLFLYFCLLPFQETTAFINEFWREREREKLSLRERERERETFSQRKRERERLLKERGITRSEGSNFGLWREF